MLEAPVWGSLNVGQSHLPQGCSKQRLLCLLAARVVLRWLIVRNGNIRDMGTVVKDNGQTFKKVKSSFLWMSVPRNTEYCSDAA